MWPGPFHPAAAGAPSTPSGQHCAPGVLARSGAIGQRGWDAAAAAAPRLLRAWLDVEEKQLCAAPRRACPAAAAGSV